MSASRYNNPACNHCDAITCRHCGLLHVANSVPCDAFIHGVLERNRGKYEEHGVANSDLWDGNVDTGLAVLYHIRDGDQLPDGISVSWILDATCSLILTMRKGNRGQQVWFGDHAIMERAIKF